MDTSPIPIIKAMLPKVPLIGKTAVFHTLGFSEHSKYWDLRTELTINVLRSFINDSPPRPLAQLQRMSIKVPEIKGRIWVSRVTMPRPDEDDVRQALFKAIEGLREDGDEKGGFVEPELGPVEAEWVGYRAGATKGSTELRISEEQKYQEMMKEVESPTTVLYFHGGAYYLSKSRIPPSSTLSSIENCLKRVPLLHLEGERENDINISKPSGSSNPPSNHQETRQTHKRPLPLHQIQTRATKPLPSSPPRRPSLLPNPPLPTPRIPPHARVTLTHRICRRLSRGKPLPRPPPNNPRASSARSQDNLEWRRARHPPPSRRSDLLALDGYNTLLTLLLHKQEIRLPLLPSRSQHLRAVPTRQHLAIDPTPQEPLRRRRRALPSSRISFSSKKLGGVLSAVYRDGAGIAHRRGETCCV